MRPLFLVKNFSSLFFFFYKVCLILNYFSFSLSLFIAASASSSLFAISAWACYFSFKFSTASNITLLSFSFYFISCACSWIFLCFSLNFFIALVDSASVSSSLSDISAWIRSFSWSLSAPAIISLSLEISASLLPSYYFSSVCFASSWIIFYFAQLIHSFSR